ncbi:hypothetical protein PSHT_06996 [Puccinia striiformis]|uniref:Uncharacterized protein n=1 Tax=Puccinia striiformis TaxID=27350 RepID=A0A2S4UPV3_9BASI|nr:hypothetical protein PSHT_13756 [Puccinia striiformis]POW15763.1 hypothetical protein PSHT_06996 [Puccinia striiformis]
MYSTKFLLVLIAMTLAARAVHAADPAFDPSTFPCPDQKKNQAVCLGTKVMPAKRRINYWRKFSICCSVPVYKLHIWSVRV